MNEFPPKQEKAISAMILEEAQRAPLDDSHSDTVTSVVKASPFTSVEFYDSKVKARAFDLFMNSGFDPVDIAMDTGVPQTVVASWILDGKWVERKRSIEAELYKAAEQKYRMFLMEHRLPTITRHLMSSKKLEDVIVKKIDSMAKLDIERVKPGELKQTAEALASTTAVAQRALGASDAQGIGATGEAKRPLVLIGVQGTVSVNQGV